MGCGAVCGASSPVAEICKEAQLLFISLFQQVTPNKFLCPMQFISNFAKEMKLYPQKLSLILTQKLIAKNVVPFRVLQKWKIILFGLDADRPTYMNCLGQLDMAQNQKICEKNYINDQNNNEKLGKTQNIGQSTELIQHKAFAQIAKDIERTFPGHNLQKKSFQTILKKISNHFPIMGYTQGINFIVGYLLIIGYSEFDTFWLFVHMAINRRCLMLGLYEDGFPLINVYLSIFRNMLKRLSDKLYKHLYEKVEMFDESAWIFKWFMTCYLSCFPLQMCQFVFDLLFCSGGLGLVKFAISLVIKLEKHLLQIEQACDLTSFFSTLKQIDTFNSYLSIKQIVKTTYSLQILRSDLNGLQELKRNNEGSDFYAKYILTKFQEDSQDRTQTLLLQQNDILKTNFIKTELSFTKNTGKQSDELLNKWYHKLLQERKQFRIQAFPIQSKKSQKRDVMVVIQQQINLQFIEPIKKIQKIETVEQIDLRNSPKVERIPKPSIEHYDSLEALKIQTQKKRDAQSIPNSPKTKSKNFNRYGQKKIKDPALWDDDDQQQQKEENKDKIEIQDQFFYASKDIKLRRKRQQQKNNDILWQFSNPTKTIENNSKYDRRRISPKAGSATDVNISRSRLARYGNNVLSSMSASGASGGSSASSHKTTQKQNSISNSRPCKCIKNKNEQTNMESLPEPRKYLRMKKQTSEIVEQVQKMENFHTMRKRINSSFDWMTNSDVPGQTKKKMIMSNIKHPSQIVSQVEIHNVQRMFKKNKVNKVDIFEINHNCQHIAEQEVSQCQSRHEPNPVLGQQQSCQSFVAVGNNSERKSEICDIQSVK